MTRRIAAELGGAKVVATGGFADVISQHTDVIDLVEPDLTLHGLRLLWEKNRAAGDD